jgi:uncharacterized cupredoxin-like copper-binding protein
MRLTFLTLALMGLAVAAQAHDATSSAAGRAGDARAPARAIEVAAVEADGRMSFSPDRVVVAKGEQVRFTIRNTGALAHEFVLGTKADNAAHARMMAAMPEMKHDDANAVTVAPGKSASLLWRFTQAGTVEFACLIPGHYQAGMHGAVTVK